MEPPVIVAAHDNVIVPREYRLITVDIAVAQLPPTRAAWALMTALPFIASSLSCY